MFETYHIRNHHSSLSEPYELISCGEHSNHSAGIAAVAPVNIVMPVYDGVEHDGDIVHYLRSLGFISGLLHFDFSILIGDIWDFLLKIVNCPSESITRTETT
jgi:hypothetical protein